MKEKRKKTLFAIKDFYHSKETFELEEIQEGVLRTQNIPENLGDYYGAENYISHHNQKKSLFDKIYAGIQSLNFSYKYKIISQYAQEGKVLDYGCGNGAFLNYLTSKKYELFGFEPNEKAIYTIKKEITIYKSIDSINEKFEIIMLWHVLEHIENPEEIISLLKEKLTDNGKLVIALPNHHSYDAKHYKEFWAAWDVPRHIYHYTKNGAISFFRQQNLYIEKLFPLPFDSYYVSLLSAKYKTGVFNKVKALFIAQISNFKALKSGEWSSVVYVLKK